MTQELIAKLESASEGSDELSAYIIKHYRAPNGEVIQSRINGKWCVYTRPGRLLENSSRGGWHRPEGWNVTESIDAALALAERVLDTRGPININICLAGSAQVVIDSSDSCGLPLAQVVASTPALAICAALLRASAAEGAGR